MRKGHYMIVKTATGRIHFANKGLYSGEIHETGEALPSPVKRGRGRPRIHTNADGTAKYDGARLAKIMNNWR